MFCYSLACWGVMLRTQQVMFSARGQLTCNTMQRHKQWREERDARFLAGKSLF